MPGAPKMDVLKTEVGGEQNFVPARHSQNGAIVANPASRRLTRRRSGTSNALDQQLFLQGHGCTPFVGESSPIYAKHPKLRQRNLPYARALSSISFQIPLD